MWLTDKKAPSWVAIPIAAAIMVLAAFGLDALDKTIPERTEKTSRLRDISRVELLSTCNAEDPPACTWTAQVRHRHLDEAGDTLVEHDTTVAVQDSRLKVLLVLLLKDINEEEGHPPLAPD